MRACARACMRASVHACTVSVRIVSHCVCVHCVFPCRDPVRALRLFLLSYMFIPRVFKPLSVQGPSACTVSVRTVSHCVSLCLRALSFCAGILCVNCALSYMFSPCMFKPLSVQGPSVYFFSFLTCSLHVCTTSIYVQGPSACTASHVFPRVFKPLSVQGPSVYFFPFLHGPSTCVQLIYVCRDPLRALCQCALCLTVSHCVCVHCLSVQDPVRALRLFFLSYMFPPRMFKPLSVQGPSTCTLSGISTPELQAAQADAKIMNSGQVRVCVCICVWGGNKFLRGCLWEGGSNLAFLLYNVILLSYKHFVLPFA